MKNKQRILILSPHSDDAELGMGGSMDKLQKEGHEILHKIFDQTYKIREFEYHRQEILEELVEICKKFKPDLVFCPSTFDCHQDHQTVCHETIRAFKMSSAILGYELPWNDLEFNNDCFIKLSKANMEKKWKMLQEFTSQFHRPYFNKEFIFSLGRVRGIQCSHPYAETFEVIRWVIS